MPPNVELRLRIRLAFGCSLQVTCGWRREGATMAIILLRELTPAKDRRMILDVALRKGTGGRFQRPSAVCFTEPPRPWSNPGPLPFLDPEFPITFSMERDLKSSRNLPGREGSARGSLKGQGYAGIGLRALVTAASHAWFGL